MDIHTQEFEKAREFIGYTPQYESLFDYLTVKEHLELYARFRMQRKSEQERKNVVEEIIFKLKLNEFTNKQARKLR